MVGDARLEGDVGERDNERFGEDGDQADVGVEDVPVPEGVEDPSEGVGVRGEEDAVARGGGAMEELPVGFHAADFCEEVSGMFFWVELG